MVIMEEECRVVGDLDVKEESKDLADVSEQNVAAENMGPAEEKVEKSELDESFSVVDNWELLGHTDNLPCNLDEFFVHPSQLMNVLRPRRLIETEVGVLYLTCVVLIPS